MIPVRVLLFASYAEALGTSAMSVEIERGETVGALLQRIQRQAGANRLPPRPLIAVNESYADDSVALEENDEVAIIPPVAGG